MLRKWSFIFYFIALDSTQLGGDEIKSTANRPVTLRKGRFSDMVGRWDWN